MLLICPLAKHGAACYQGSMIGESIEKLIEDKFGPSKLGHVADALGISRPYMSDICNNRRGLSSEVAVKLSGIFGERVCRSLFVKQAEIEFEEAKRRSKRS